MSVPSTATTLWSLAMLSLRRLRRSRAPWIALVIASLPVFFGVAANRAGQHSHLMGDIYVAEMLVLAVLPAMFVAASIAEDIEDRTTAYVWSRPIARWSVIIGKLLALAPVAMLLVAGGWALAVNASGDGWPPARTTGAMAAGALAMSLLSTGIATLAPKHGMALTIVYVIVFDLPIGEIPASLQILSITHQTRLLAGISTTDGPLAPLITLAVLGGLWLALSLWRIKRLEV